MRSMLILADGLDEYFDAEPAYKTQAKLLVMTAKARIQLYVGGILRNVVDRAETAKVAWNALREECMGELQKGRD
jgi:hypothetical protein